MRDPLEPRSGPPAPLLLPALAQAAGIAFNDVAGRGPVLYVAGLLIAAGLLVWPLARREALKLTVALAAFCCGALLHELATNRFAGDHVIACTAEEPVLARFRGRVVSEPQIVGTPDHPFSPWWPLTDRTRFLLSVTAVETDGGWVRASGRVRVNVRAPLLGLVAGDEVEAFGSCYRIPSPENPGQFDAARHERRRGVVVGLSCQHAECVYVLAPGAGTRWKLWTRLRERARALLLGELIDSGEAEGTLLDTMLLGRRTAIDPKVNESFQRTGLTHYLAVSGMNVAILALLFWGIGRALGASHRTSAILVIAAVLLYGWMTDPLPPIQRATVMAVAVCLSMLLGRPRNFLNGLCLASIVILAAAPGSLFDAGFQLSFMALLGIVYLAPALIAAFRDGAGWLGPRVGLNVAAHGESTLFVRSPDRSRVRRWIRKCGWGIGAAAAISIAAWLATLPIILLHFGRLAPWGWLSTLLVAPLVGLIMSAGPAKLLVALVWPSAAAWLTFPVQALSSVLIWLVEWLAKLPWSTVAVPVIPLWLAAVVYAAGLAVLARRRLRFGRHLTRIMPAVAVAGVLIWLAPRSGDGYLTMTVLSVGRGTSVVLELPDGRAMLYDAGASGGFDPGRTVILPFLRQRGIRRLEAVFVSHPDLDHVGGLPSVLDAVPVETIFVGPRFEAHCRASPIGETLLAELGQSGRAIRALQAGDPQLEYDGARVDVLWPPADLVGTANDSSLVLRLASAGKSILLTGDIETQPQGVLARSPELRTDVLLLPHHGALEQASEAFISASGAEVLVSSTFVRTPDRPAAYQRLASARRHYSTADVGAITVRLRPDRIEVETMRSQGQAAAIRE